MGDVADQVCDAYESSYDFLESVFSVLMSWETEGCGDEGYEVEVSLEEATKALCAYVYKHEEDDDPDLFWMMQMDPEDAMTDFYERNHYLKKE